MSACAALLVSLLPMTAGAGQLGQDGGSKPYAPNALTERLSLPDREAQGNGARGVEGVPVAHSAHGRFVAFYSFATNLVPRDTNGLPDIFLRDKQAGTT